MNRDTPARPTRRPTDDLEHRERQRRIARGVNPDPRPDPVSPPQWVWGERGQAVALFPSVFNAGNFNWAEVPAAGTITSVTIVNVDTGERQTYPIHIESIDGQVDEVVEEPAPTVWRRTYDHAIVLPHGSYTPFDGSFDYFANDPAQWEHGADGGTPMTVAELLGADEKMDEIDRMLDGQLE